ncbi:hypothetical protein CXZ10_20440 [Pleomorphomonas diazotrophica]|uniref:Uncharacterized protein n=1 Tax=Pleomorphomonas diazotrophica TaxID=1166257 RepID=A0A1I4V5S4_9HYPH|nr:hypothetical protein [Pleomorphomonas diazotrophica]PKR87415.1 hypothetical protein CXZ10_20440 [Pleomorphomonas diazotrophica]SFM96493.1 hypothetical protein SAMN05192571_11094 [Pleomorphomonas diazotrophica]
MLGLLGKFGSTAAVLFGLVVGGAVAFAVLQLYDAFIDDPAVARVAREGFVAASEKLALQGQVEEMRRQFKLAEATAATDRARAEAANREADDAWKRYEAAVAADSGDDGCRVTDGDLEWLRQSRPAPHGSLP